MNTEKIDGISDSPVPIDREETISSMCEKGKIVLAWGEDENGQPRIEMALPKKDTFPGWSVYPLSVMMRFHRDKAWVDDLAAWWDKEVSNLGESNEESASGEDLGKEGAAS